MLYENLLYSIRRDVVFIREPDGNALCNVPHAVHCYGVRGFDWSINSREVRELALNILHWWIPGVHDPDGTVWIYGNSVSRRVWGAHRDFAADFLIRIPYEGGQLSLRDAHPWLLERIVWPKESQDAGQNARGGSGDRNVRPGA